MPNMEHARYRNTLTDLEDCQTALSELSKLDEIVKPEERKAAIKLIQTCAAIGADWLEDANRAG